DRGAPRHPPLGHPPPLRPIPATGARPGDWRPPRRLRRFSRVEVRFSCLTVTRVPRWRRLPHPCPGTTRTRTAPAVDRAVNQVAYWERPPIREPSDEKEDEFDEEVDTLAGLGSSGRRPVRSTGEHLDDPAHGRNDLPAHRAGCADDRRR